MRLTLAKHTGIFGMETEAVVRVLGAVFDPCLIPKAVKRVYQDPSRSCPKEGSWQRNGPWRVKERVRETFDAIPRSIRAIGQALGPGRNL